MSITKTRSARGQYFTVASWHKLQFQKSECLLAMQVLHLNRVRNIII